MALIVESRLIALKYTNRHDNHYDHEQQSKQGSAAHCHNLPQRNVMHNDDRRGNRNTTLR